MAVADLHHAVLHTKQHSWYSAAACQQICSYQHAPILQLWCITLRCRHAAPRHATSHRSCMHLTTTTTHPSPVHLKPTHCTHPSGCTAAGSQRTAVRTPPRWCCTRACRCCRATPTWATWWRPSQSSTPQRCSSWPQVGAEATGLCQHDAVHIRPSDPQCAMPCKCASLLSHQQWTYT